MLSGLGILLALGPPVGGNRGMLVALAALDPLECPGVPPTGRDSLDLDLSVNETPLLALDLDFR
jgi:hypothetical protein